MNWDELPVGQAMDLIKGGHRPTGGTGLISRTIARSTDENTVTIREVWDTTHPNCPFVRVLARDRLAFEPSPDSVNDLALLAPAIASEPVPTE